MADLYELQSALNHKARLLALQRQVEAKAARVRSQGMRATGSMSTSLGASGWTSLKTANNVMDEATKRTLALTVLGEAGGENLRGQQAVAWVIKNRAGSGIFPSDPAKVALQPKQFSTWNKGAGGNNPGKYLGTPQYKTALQTIDQVFGGSISDPTRGALGYIANQGPNAIARPSWFDKAATAGTEQIGHHLFAATQPAAPSAPTPMPGRPAFPQSTKVTAFSVNPDGSRVAAPVTAAQTRAEQQHAAVPTALTSHSVKLLKLDDSGNPILTAAPNYDKLLNIHDRNDAQPIAAGKTMVSSAITPALQKVQEQLKTNGIIKTVPTEGLQQFQLPPDYHPDLRLPTPQAIPKGPKPSGTYQPFKLEDRLVTVYDRVEVHPEKNVAALPSAKVTIAGGRGNDVKEGHGVALPSNEPAPFFPPQPVAPVFKTVPRQTVVKVKVPNPVAAPRPVVRPAAPLHQPVTAPPPTSGYSPMPANNNVPGATYFDPNEGGWVSNNSNPYGKGNSLAGF